jgi:hypothetical protein
MQSTVSKSFLIQCLLLIAFISLVNDSALSQSSDVEWGGIHIEDLSGELSLESKYISQKETRNQVLEEDRTVNEYLAKLDLNSSSYILHPNFLTIDLGGSYSPAQRQDDYLTTPERTEASTAESLNLRTTLFKERQVSLTSFANYAHSYINREFLTSIESDRTDFGGSVNYKNAVLPFNLSAAHADWTETELDLDRDFSSVRDNVALTANRSFMNYDQHNLTLAYDQYSRSYYSSERTESGIAALTLDDLFYFDAKRQDRYQSRIWYYDQSGDQGLERTQINQGVAYGIARGFRVNGDYQFSQIGREQLNSEKHDFRTRLEHQLYQSLRSFVSVEHSEDYQSAAQESIDRADIGFDYTKKIPTGNFNFGYTYGQLHDQKSSDSLVDSIVAEEKTIRDGEVSILNRAGVILSSVRVQDSTATLTYIETIDYILISRGDFVEIQRIPSGSIRNGATVLIDYLSDFGGNFDLNSTSSQIYTSLNLFDGFLRPNFRYAQMDDGNSEGTGLRTLQDYKQTVYGLDLNYSILTSGAKFDRFQSELVPYHSSQYYLALSDSFMEKLMLSISANYRDIDLIEDEEKQKYYDITGQASYLISNRLKFNLSASQRVQRGRSIDLDLYTAKAELVGLIRNLTLTVGVESFFRDLLHEETDYSNIYTKISRKFGK